MNRKRIKDCIDPEFEALMAEEDPDDTINRFEEITTISDEINAASAGTWTQAESGNVEIVDQKFAD